MWNLADAFKNATILAGVVLLVLIVYRHFHRRFVAHDRQLCSAKTESSRDPGFILPSQETNFMQWQVEMHELATSMKGELDSKMRLLQMLIGEARIEAERLERLLAEWESRQTRL
jgi:hypothetical protein